MPIAAWRLAIHLTGQSMNSNFVRNFASAWLAAAAFLVLDARAADAPTDSYAIFSSIGDELTIVTYLPSVGSNLDTNGHQVVPLGEGQFDRRASGFTGAAIRRSVPGIQLQTLPPERTAFDGSDEQLAADSTRAALIDALKPQLRSGVHYLVVIGKHCADAVLKMAHTTAGTGKLAGLGFYLDDEMRVISGNGNQGIGFIAPYAYLSATLIDLRTGAIVRSESAQESTTIGTGRSPTAGNPWDALTAAQKVRALNVLVKRAIDDMIPRLVAPA